MDRQTNTHKDTDAVIEVTITSQAHSTIKIEGEIPYVELLKHRATAIATLGKEVSFDGFRKGHIPEKVLVERLGEMAIITEMAERALALAYPHIIREHAIDALGHPQITLTKIAPGNPLGFSALVAVVPTITLPDYKSIAKTIPKEMTVVTDEDVDETIADIQRQKRAYEHMQVKAALKRDAHETDAPAPLDNIPEEAPSETDTPFPKLTDEYVKTLGDFSTVEDFKTKLRAHLLEQKSHENAGKHRSAITDAIIGASVIDLPDVLIDAEIGQMFGQMEQDLTRANLTLVDYLGHIKKTREELASQWRPAAEKRAKLQLILNDIVVREKIVAPAEAVDREVVHLMEQHKDADKTRVQLYVASVLRNEEVLTMLEKESERQSP